MDPVDDVDSTVLSARLAETKLAPPETPRPLEQIDTSPAIDGAVQIKGKAAVKEKKPKGKRTVALEEPVVLLCSVNTPLQWPPASEVRPGDLSTATARAMRSPHSNACYAFRDFPTLCVGCTLLEAHGVSAMQR